MKLLMQYVKQNLSLIMVFICIFVLQMVCYRLYQIPMDCIVYVDVLSLLILLVFGMIRFFRMKKTYEQLTKINDADIASVVEYPSFVTKIEKEQYRIIQMLIASHRKQMSLSNEQHQQMMDYYTVWVHQIKTPIASMKLQLQNEDTPFSHSIERDLFRIEQYVDMVLTYLRLDSTSTDYVFKEYDIDTIMKKVIRRLSAEFIAKKLTLDFQPLHMRVVTDEKWISFVFEQVLTNAIKYTNTGSISIYGVDDGICIEDTGMGIKQEDLPRIFENGYTGYNGRENQRATGIGLYLCKRTCDALNHKISVQSVVDQGTCVKIEFLQNCKK